MIEAFPVIPNNMMRNIPKNEFIVVRKIKDTIYGKLYAYVNYGPLPVF